MGHLLTFQQTLTSCCHHASVAFQVPSHVCHYTRYHSPPRTHPDSCRQISHQWRACRCPRCKSWTPQACMGQMERSNQEEGAWLTSWNYLNSPQPVDWFCCFSGWWSCNRQVGNSWKLLRSWTQFRADRRGEGWDLMWWASARRGTAASSSSPRMRKLVVVQKTIRRARRATPKTIKAEIDTTIKSAFLCLRTVCLTIPLIW